ncbi:hypothetical protein GCM10017557_23300 [Streptomyces aurantiacus]|uniref:Uncharacterized protein n=1 Tax=Streptomyces aurantiacus TaxID=47760 RepID=A0A7G1NYN5_9ACTN|nr:hypothetical protein GCM10017557_23300 [Streptomyces aurantiacus]
MTGGRTRGWWEEYREILPSDALDLAELEHHARALREHRVSHRLKRQTVVYEGATPLSAIIHEAALRMSSE